MNFDICRNRNLRGRKVTGNWLCPAMHARLIYTCQPVKWVRFSFNNQLAETRDRYAHAKDGGLFQRSNRSDVDLFSKQNSSTYKNNSKNPTVTDITSFFLTFVFYFRFTISMKTTAKRTT